jgi:hypothetical protein
MVLATTLLASLAPTARAEVMELENLDTSRVRWSKLTYRAKKLTFSAGTELELSSVAAAQAKELLVTPESGAPRAPAATGVTLLKMETSGMGQDSLTQLWINPGDATALQRDQHDRGKRKRWRAYRYLDDGVASVTHRPASGEESGSPEAWSDRSTGLFEYPEWLGDGALITEPAAIFFIASAAKLDKAGDSIQVPVFTKNKLLLVELKVEGSDQLRANYTEVSSSGERQVSGRVDTVRILLDSRRLGPESTEGDFEFLGLRGDVEMWLDKKTRVPIQISGRVPVAGKANVRLQRAVID